MCLIKILDKHTREETKKSAPITGYKVVFIKGYGERERYHSLYFDTTFFKGETYLASDDRIPLEACRKLTYKNTYKSGFHVYKNLKDAKLDLNTKGRWGGRTTIIKVRGYKITTLGLQEITLCEDPWKTIEVPCFVCQEMKILGEVT